MSGILHSITYRITPTIIGQTADMLGEKDINIAKAMRSAALLILAGMLQGANRPNVLDTVFQTPISDATAGDTVLPIEWEDQQIFHEQLTALFGDKLPAIHSAIAAFSRVNHASVPAIMAMTMSIIGSVLHPYISANKLDRNGLIQLLGAEKRELLNLLPPTFQSILGLKPPQPSVQKDSDPQPRSNTRWLWPLVSIIILGSVIIFYMKNCAK